MLKKRRQQGCVYERSKTGFCIIFIILAILATALTAGCTGTASENMVNAEPENVTVEEISATPTPTQEPDVIDMDEVIAIDLVMMDQDIQNKNPLAFEYEIIPTCCTGINEKGEYEFEGTITEFTTDGSTANYAGVLFTEKDDGSDTGYHEWVYKGLKFNVYGGETDQNIKMKFTVDKDDIPQGKTIIMSGYDFYRI